MKQKSKSVILQHFTAIKKNYTRFCELWAEYKKVKQPAYAEYEKVQQAAYAEYEKVKQAAFDTFIESVKLLQ